MSVLWLKVWFDLWSHKGRTAIVVLSMAAGIFSLGAIFGMSALMLSGMNQAHQATQPSHISMFIGPAISASTAERLAQLEGVAGIEAANFITMRYKLNPTDPWEAGWLVMRADYQTQRYDQYQLKAGQWPSDLSVGIERLSSQYYSLDLGDTVIFEIDGRPRTLNISSRIRHPFVPPPQFGGPAVFFIDAEGLQRFGVPPGRYGQLLIQVSPYSRDLAREVAAEIKARLAVDGVRVALTNYQNPTEHWGSPFMEGFYVVLQVLAVISVAASVVIIFNILTALITQQTDQIGIIKAVGGQSGVVLKIYLSVVLIYGLLALLVALPLSTLVSFWLTRTFLNLFNIDYDIFQFSRSTLGLQVAAGVIVPLLAGLWPLTKAATLTVREAIATYGLGSDFGTNAFDRGVERLAERLLSAPYAIALTNMFRRKGRLILTQLVLLTAGLMFLTVMSMRSSILLTLDNDFERRQYDARILFEQNERINVVTEQAEGVAGVAQAEMWSRYNANLLLNDGRQGREKEAGLGAELIGIPNGSTIFRPILVAGRWLLPQEGYAILISQAMADLNEIGVGDSVTLDLGVYGEQDWVVVGIFQDIYGFQIGTTDPIYANQQAVFAATKQYNRGRDLYVQSENRTETATETMVNRVKTLFEARQVDVNTSETLYDLRRGTENQFNILITMLLSLAIIVAAVGGIGLMGSLSISVVERTREIGVMRSIGAQDGVIIRTFVLEGILQGWLSWVLVLPLAFALSRPLADALGMVVIGTTFDFRFSGLGVLLWLILIVVISGGAAIIPARHAANISVRESLAYV